MFGYEYGLRWLEWVVLYVRKFLDLVDVFEERCYFLVFVDEGMLILKNIVEIVGGKCVIKVVDFVLVVFGKVSIFFEFINLVIEVNLE